MAMQALRLVAAISVAPLCHGAHGSLDSVTSPVPDQDCAAQSECGQPLHDETSQLQLLTEQMAGSEPRVFLTNVAHNKKLTVNKDWEASTECQSSRCDWFKLQIVKNSANGVVNTTTIRTDWPPQSLLDRRNLKFQGGAFNADKFYNKNRWWGVTWGNVSFHKVKGGWSPQAPQLAFWTYESRDSADLEFLSMSSDGTINLQKYPASSKVIDLPKDVIWEVTIAGTALSPEQVAFGAALVPLIVIGGALTGGGVWVGVGAAAGSAAATTSAYLTIAGASITAASYATGEVLNYLKATSRMFFVPE